MAEYLITWQIDVEGDDPLSAVLEAEMAMAGQLEQGRKGVGGGVFGWEDEQGGKGWIDLETHRLDSESQADFDE